MPQNEIQRVTLDLANYSNGEGFAIQPVIGGRGPFDPVSLDDGASLISVSDLATALQVELETDPAFTGKVTVVGEEFLNLVSGAIIDLDADDLEGSNGSNVTSWDGGGVTLTPHSTAPTLAVNAINGHNAVTFSSSPMKGDLDSSLAAPSTFFLVYSPNTNTSDYVVFDGEYGAGSGRQMFYQGSNGAMHAYQSGFLASSADQLDAKPLLVCVVFNGASSKIRVNGFQIASGSTGTDSTLTKLVLGSDGGLSAFPLAGKIAKLVAYSGVLTNDQIAINEYELIRHYAIEQAATFLIRDFGETRLLVPRTLADATAAPLVIYHHGSSESLSSINNEDKAEVVEALIAAGYRILSCDASGNNWGSAAAIQDYKDAYEIWDGIININKVVFLGQSMGGMTGLLSLVDAYWEGIPTPVQGFYGIYPACNLANVYANGFQTAIDAAYDIPGGGDYATQTAGHDPVLISSSEYAGKRLRFTASYSDGLIDRTENSDAMSTHVSGDATEYEVVTHTGVHGDPSAFLPSDIVAFFGRCS